MKIFKFKSLNIPIFYKYAISKTSNSDDIAFLKVGNIKRYQTINYIVGFSSKPISIHEL